MEKYKGKLIGNTIIFRNIKGEQKTFDFYTKPKDLKILKEWIDYYKTINILDFQPNNNL